jgi:predicted house-cleaning noncanonical NTP pyrophosphatase (MazG superfamily)
MKTFNIETAKDKTLISLQDKLFESLSNILNDEEIETLNLLLEIERELTLREEI